MRGAESSEKRVIRWARSGGWSEVSRGPLGGASNLWGRAGRKVKFGMFEKKVESLFLGTATGFSLVPVSRSLERSVGGK